jgi:hypothetical protein
MFCIDYRFVDADPDSNLAVYYDANTYPDPYPVLKQGQVNK